jgi:hypothetical protein
MDAALKILVFTLLGAALLAANAWYVSAIVHTIKGGRLVIAPISVISEPAETHGTSEALGRMLAEALVRRQANEPGGIGEALARMLVVRLRSVMRDLEQAQNFLQKADEVRGSRPPEAVDLPLFGTPRTVRLDTRLFQPAEIEVKVAGVELGGLLPRLQGWFVEDRTLSFTVSLQGPTTIVAGNLDALGDSRARPIWIRRENLSPEAIVDEIALALIQRVWGKDEAEIGELSPEEFKTLVRSVGKVAEINRRVRTLKVPARLEYEAVLDDLVPLAQRFARWNRLSYFVATIAEGAEDDRRALMLYRRLKENGGSPIASEILETKLKALVEARETAFTLSVSTYRERAKFATEEMGKLFSLTLPTPPIKQDVRWDAPYWGGDAIYMPAGIEDIPDLVEFGVAWLFIGHVWKFGDEDQSEALVKSYNDVLCSIVKQARLHQTAQQADWVIAPGYLTWLEGKTQRDHWPYRSLKAPGTAFSGLGEWGNDTQVAHYRHLVTTGSASYRAQVNSGIPNRAFYEAAMKIGTDKAGRIWVEALKRFKPDLDLPMASKTIQTVASELYGDKSPEAIAVQEAWEVVGL